jgi:hypothetical protein
MRFWGAEERGGHQRAIPAILADSIRQRRAGQQSLAQKFAPIDEPHWLHNFEIHYQIQLGVSRTRMATGVTREATTAFNVNADAFWPSPQIFS